MKSLFEIGSYRFLAPTMLDATQEAMLKAKELMKTGHDEEAKALYDAAFTLRRGLQQTASSRPQGARRAFA